MSVVGTFAIWGAGETGRPGSGCKQEGALAIESGKTAPNLSAQKWPPGSKNENKSANQRLNRWRIVVSAPGGGASGGCHFVVFVEFRFKEDP
jgi:hypothetical protein